jgi:pimeloyl-ACP methyl ester carboxylesterase
MNPQLTKVSTVFLLSGTLLLTGLGLANPVWATISCDQMTFENLISTGVIRPPDQFLSDRTPNPEGAKSIHVDSVALRSSPVQHCEVLGHIHTALTHSDTAGEGTSSYPQGKEIQFRIKLPDNWNQKLMMLGQGQLAGAVSGSTLGASENSQLSRGYATMVTDTGHFSPAINDGSWAKDLDSSGNLVLNLDRLKNFGYRAVHLTVVVGKQVTKAYYLTDLIRQTYLVGCSTGGRQGLVAANKYPDDFDGMSLGHPATISAFSLISNIWVSQVVFPDSQIDLATSNWSGPGVSVDPVTGVIRLRPAFPPSKIQLLDQINLASCDLLDSVQDGIITDPRQCNTDKILENHRCPPGPGDTSMCFIDSEVDALKKLYAGPRNENPNSRFFGQLWPGYPPGYEAITPGGWAERRVGIDVGDGVNIIAKRFPNNDPQYPTDIYAAIQERLKFLTEPAIEFHAFDMNSDEHINILLELAPILYPGDPELTEFRKNGGKILFYHGWADPSQTALGTIEHLRKIFTNLGGPSHANETSRLFLVPGMRHCGVSDRAPDRFDSIAPLEKWVEQGVPPGEVGNEIVAQRLNTVTAQPDMARPLCVYPSFAKLKDNRDADDPSVISNLDNGNFECVIPVSIDIKPGDSTNTVNPSSGGVVPVAILGSWEFDATKVDSLSLRINGAPVVAGKSGKPLCHSDKDVNGDGFFDVVCQVVTSEIEAGSGKAVLTGLVNYGGNFVHLIRGEDKITVRPGIRKPGRGGGNKQ